MGGGSCGCDSWQQVQSPSFLSTNRVGLLSYGNRGSAPPACCAPLFVADGIVRAGPQALCRCPQSLANVSADGAPHGCCTLGVSSALPCRPLRTAWAYLTMR